MPRATLLSFLALLLLAGGAAPALARRKNSKAWKSKAHDKWEAAQEAQENGFGYTADGQEVRGPAHP